MKQIRLCETCGRKAGRQRVRCSQCGRLNCARCRAGRDCRDHQNGWPIPGFAEVRDIIEERDDRFMLSSLALIVPQPGMGCFNVIRLFVRNGEARCIGRELNMDLARRVASRPHSEDGQPVTPV